MNELYIGIGVAIGILLFVFWQLKKIEKEQNSKKSKR